MSWSHYPQRKTEDTLLSITTSGELAFWRHDRREGWTSTGRVRTGRTDIRLARYSSAKKTVLVTSTPAGEELTIWDSQESEFSRGLEFTQLFEPEEIVNDLDWSSTYQSHSILAVGFARHILIMCEQRMTYFEQEPAWRVCHKIDITLLTSHSIIDSIWLSGGSLLVGAGHQMFLYGRSEQSASTEAVPRTNYLLEYVLQQNAPLVDFHPQVLLQCLLWGRVELVKDIIVKLANAAAVAERQDSPVAIKIDPQVVEDFWSSDHITVKDPSTQIKKQYQLLFDHEDSSDDGISFTRPVITRLLEFLVKNPMPELTQLENVHLSILIQTTLEIDEQRRALDANGLRYLISMRLFYLINKRAASVPETATLSAGISNKLSGRGRIRFRDIVWAYHSETQEIILAASSAACGNKMTWNDARALGVFLWLHGHEQLKAQMEIVARNQYMADDSRDPTACSLLYFALRKIKLVHGLWKQAAWHPEQKIMLKFLSKNFDEPQSKTAALKNAFALLAKQRFEYAAAFFLLGGSLKDAVNVCLKHLKDFQLAVAIARVIEQGDDGPILRDILERTVIPTAFREGNRWLGSWAFWVLRRRDLAVRILVTPLVELAPTLPMPVSEIGDNHYDDPSLALLFSQIRSMTLQTVKGTSEISGRTEFRFVMQIARVFCRMGCHVLALALVRSWPFARPITSLQSSGTNEASATEIIPRAEPVGPTRPDFALRGSRRRSQIAIDMDISGLPPTRRGSPSPEGRSESKPVVEAGEMLPEADSADAIARHAALGNLMRSARKNISTPEFDMDSFFPTSTSTISPLPAVSEQPAQESVPSSKQPEIKTEETAAGTNLMKAKAKAHAPVVVPEFDMNNFF
ncbi:hypothetical protein SISSUDRAFT_713707 [Sistotremastrum suecicum HHB10207 ss-3]|uniref:RAVE complex protein Rav1 C-terminal domain-containing protein n=1 Tax=Sistotremastrum suecicum HHB10207 ss-3 TaxID=1314776 RepID=A0A165WV22_9AGAM|nr:hypothetical protein SISSUDRAFT_713707 [Sistotremastrum suecicum HHB10207 ss-3]